MDEAFSGLVLNAAADSDKWSEVLQHLLKVCGARKGVITLRDLDTAKLYFPEEASAELSAPLLCNFAPEHLSSYFDRYADCDVWTTIEQRHYPHKPYFMSDHLSIDELKQCEFWHWLEPQGICECLVAEIHRSQRHWVALNLHFAQITETEKSEILSVLAVHLPAIRTGWSISDRLVGLGQANAASQGYLEHWHQPSLILDEDLVITSVNRLALEAFPTLLGTGQALSPGTPLQLPPGNLRTTLEMLRECTEESAVEHELISVPGDTGKQSIRISRIAQGTDVVGKRRAHFLMVADAPTAPSAVADTATPRIWQTGDLTKKQSQIVQWVAEGGLIPAYARRHKVTAKTAYDHLFAARQKLGGMSARDIYTNHQALLRVERSSSRDAAAQQAR